MKTILLPLCCSFAILELEALRAAQGDLDPTWGGTGKVTTTFLGGASDDAFALTLQGDGKVLLAGVSDGNFALVRYNPNGSLDTTFNGTGRVTTNFGSADRARSIALQGDGKILLGGYTGSGSDTSMALARYNPNGSLDTSFNGTGMRTLDLSLQGDEIFDLKLQSDGKILATGVTFTSLVVLRLNIDGSLDNSFNGNGRVTAANATGTNLALQPDGKIVVGGWGSPSGSFNDFLAMRFNPNGTPDTSFNGTGKVLTPVSNSEDNAWSVALQGNGKIVLAGSARDGADKFAVVRYNADGSLDPSFNGTGKVITAVGTVQDFARDMTLQSDGKILVAGSSYNSTLSNTDFALLRYNIDGSLDTSFSGDGKVTTNIGSGDEGTAIALQPDGRILLGGDARIGSTSDFADFAVLRYLGATPVPEPGSSLLAASAGALLLACRRRARG